MPGKKKIEWDDTKRQFMIAVGASIKQRREAEGKSLKSLAAELDLTDATLSRIENGKQDFLASYFSDFARVLKVHPKELMP